jgi:hypothetical protein
MDEMNISECRFSSDIVPYMYGELSSGASLLFESHLPACEVCTEEFATVSSARFEVYDWKKAEFDPLVPPVFAIPFAAGGEHGASWLDKVRSAFSNSWAVPGFTFAGLAIVAVITGFAFFSANNTGDIAKQDDSRQRPTVAQPEPQPQPQPQNEARLPTDEREIAESAAEDSRFEEPVTAPAPRKRAERNPKPKAASREVNAVAISTTSPTAPRLNEFPEDEDTSLRLAQLFDDIDTRD